MASNLIYDESNWLFPDPQKNQIHDMAESIDTLERAILKQPYNSMHLEFDRSAEKASLDDPISSITYESEKKRLEKLLQKQETDH